MSSPAQTTEGAQGPASAAAGARWHVPVRSLVLAVLITLFAVFNLKEVKVNWVFGSGKAPLIIVIVVSLLVGIVLTYFADRHPRKRR